MVLLLALINFVFTDVQSTTYFGDALDKPVLKNGAAFVFKYHFVTPESESKVRQLEEKLSLIHQEIKAAHRSQSTSRGGLVLFATIY